MKHLIHRLRRKDYATHDRWRIFGLLGLVTLMLLMGGLWGSLKSPNPTEGLSVADVNVIPVVVPIFSDDANDVAVITIVGGDGKPASGVWIGLKASETTIPDLNFRYEGWYSPSPQRVFYKTNDLGQVAIPLRSSVPEEVVYIVYVANRSEVAAAKYYKLPGLGGFVVNYEIPNS